MLIFSEAIKAGAGNIVISNGTDDVRTISVIDSSQVSIAFNSPNLNPVTDFLAGITYHVEIALGVIKDMANNNFAGISGFTAFDFTTAAFIG